MKLQYNASKWRKLPSIPVKTLQLFITNRCNKRCPECFYKENLGPQDMSFSQYKNYVGLYCLPTDIKDVPKVILIGGEPTLHSNIQDMIRFNHDHGLRTTVYTNGTNPKILESVADLNVTIRIGVHGYDYGYKPITKIEPPDYKVTIVYMLDTTNYRDLDCIADYVEEEFNCDDLYISSIRELQKTGNFWLDSDNTIPLSPDLEFSYPRIINDFVQEYGGGIKRLHICRRGVLENTDNTYKCRYLNIFPDGSMTACPWDIPLGINKFEDLLKLYRIGHRWGWEIGGCRKNNNKECILQKIVLEQK